MQSKKKFPSELRFSLASKDWVVIATGRARRPETFKKEKRKVIIPPKKDCPFCNIETQKEPVLIYSNNSKQNKIVKDWTLIVIPNLYPAFMPSKTLRERAEGPHQLMDAVGFHEVVVTRDHKKQMAEFSLEQVKEVIDSYQSRYISLMDEPFVNYISLFHNHGEEAGASMFHPHSQIIALPVMDPQIKRSLNSSRQYFSSHNQCMHCFMNKWDKESKKRIIFENKEFLVVCPFASKASFQIAINPKKHLPYFEKITEEQKKYLAEAFQAALSKLNKGLNNPAYNFYLRTSPCDDKDYSFYHWHWVILPKTSIMAGFELGTGIEISTIEPEKAAAYLKKL